jgi:hypothetical protein
MNALLILAALLLVQSPNGTATGLIRSATGQPAAGVRVAAMTVPNSETGTGEGALVSLTQSDNTGRYRLENVPPGRYYIQAGLVDFPTYYPGVITTTGATSILISAGAVVANLDFTITQSTGVRISGRVPGGVGRPGLVAITGGPTSRFTTTQLTPDGTFEFLKVMPGNYTLQASPANGLPNLPLLVADKDIEIGVPTGPGVQVSGVVGLGPRSPRPAGQRVVLSGTTNGWTLLEGPVSANGTFSVAGVPPGTYNVKTVPGPPTTLTTVVVADREIAGVRVGAYAEVPGKAVLPDGRQFPASSSATMIEARPSQGATLATAVRADGAFRFPLSEGEYRISIGKLPAGMAVQSISYGTIDLMKNPLKLDGTTDLSELRITIETRP